MRYSPGSFTKNFAWHGTGAEAALHSGLGKLHAAIERGYGGKLAPVDRQAFRNDCGLGGDIDLIPVNFFLHNRDGGLSVDELVARAVTRPHSRVFDRLALFAFHLNRAGSGVDVRSRREIAPRPAMWANELVRERLWSEGAWRKAALDDAPLADFLALRMAAEASGRRKCHTNYRHLFQLCGYLSSPLPFINTGAGELVGPALFLAWDRHLLDGGAADRPALLELVDADEIHKLLGAPGPWVKEQAGRLVDIYLGAGALDRLAAPAPVSVLGLSGQAPLDRLAQEESDAVVERRAVERLEQKRDRAKAAALKLLYANTCQFCGTRLQIGNEQFHAEAAHIKPLGKPHDGPDRTSNVLVLCPNHHLQLDRGVLWLETAGKSFRLRSMIHGDPLDGRTVEARHEIDPAFVSWHRSWSGHDDTT